MPDEVTGTADAKDAAVDTEAEVAAPAEDRAELERVVAAAKAKVEKLQAHLAGAEQVLAAARAALDGGNN